MSRVNLSTHFYLDEFEKSNTAERLGIDNSVLDEHMDDLKTLVGKVLQPIRNRWGSVKVNSGYRSVKLNEQIGGATKSQHMKGEAADIVLPRMGDVFWWVVDNLEFDQIIWEFGCDNTPDWIHVSFSRSSNRKQVLRAKKVNKRTVYETFTKD